MGAIAKKHNVDWQAPDVGDVGDQYSNIDQMNEGDVDEDDIPGRALIDKKSG